MPNSPSSPRSWVLPKSKQPHRPTNFRLRRAVCSQSNKRRTATNKSRTFPSSPRGLQSVEPATKHTDRPTTRPHHTNRSLPERAGTCRSERRNWLWRRCERARIVLDDRQGRLGDETALLEQGRAKQPRRCVTRIGRSQTQPAATSWSVRSGRQARAERDRVDRLQRGRLTSGLQRHHGRPGEAGQQHHPGLRRTSPQTGGQPEVLRQACLNW